MKIDISEVMAAESALAREESNNLESAMEYVSDDVVKREARSLKAMLGDVANIPKGHPIRVAIEEARIRYEEDQALRREEKSLPEVELKKARKIDARKEDRHRREKIESSNERVRSAAKLVNLSMTEAVDALRRLSRNIEASSDDFSRDRHAQMKLQRLNRVLQATVRGIVESKVNVGRVVENG